MRHSMSYRDLFTIRCCGIMQAMCSQSLTSIHPGVADSPNGCQPGRLSLWQTPRGRSHPSDSSRSLSLGIVAAAGVRRRSKGDPILFACLGVPPNEHAATRKVFPEKHKVGSSTSRGQNVHSSLASITKTGVGTGCGSSLGQVDPPCRALGLKDHK